MPAPTKVAEGGKIVTPPLVLLVATTKPSFKSSTSFPVPPLLVIMVSPLITNVSVLVVLVFCVVALDGIGCNKPSSLEQEVRITKLDNNM